MSVPHRSVDVLIIGGGVIGLSLAWELSQRDKRVCVLASKRTGRTASWAGAGILPPAAAIEVDDPLEKLRQLSLKLHPAWAEQLQGEAGISTGFSQCGGLYLATTPAESATLAANRFWWEEHAIEHQEWSSDEVVQREPALRNIAPNLKAAWFLPGECQLRNPRHLKALEQACRGRGVAILDDAHVEELVIEDGMVTGVRTDIETYRAQQYCLCSGAWARLGLGDLDISNGIMPVRGQMVLYRAETPLVQRIINEGHRYMLSRDDGLLLAGSVEEEVGYECETTAEGLARIQTWAKSILPQVASLPIEATWAGLRPGSYDGFPYMGRIEHLENLYVAAGHFRSGLTLSPGTAVVMAELMCDGQSSMDLHSFRPGRG